ncbi:MAG: type II toxin-antitoxin system prevent-host-death family antitoxin [Caldilinea sp. CFX5]|nr:type II toxin-antitoxin system prevent-host-death family antitoxin [Caldilinea sp. CFX5]
MNAVTITAAKRNLEQLITQVIDNADPTIVSTDNGKQIVMMPLDEFNSWQETIYLLSSPANAAHLRRSIAQAKAGQTMERELIEE